MMGSKDRAARALLPLQQAIYHAVHDVKGGVGAICGVYGFNHNTLQLKVSPNIATHQLNLRELEAVIAYTRDPRIMDSLCAVYGNVAWIDLGEPIHAEGLTLNAMLQQIGEAGSNLGRLAQDFAQSLNDGHIDRDELAVIEKTSMRLIQSVQGLLEQARQQVLDREATFHG